MCPAMTPAELRSSSGIEPGISRCATASVSPGALCVVAALSGVLSVGLLALAISTDYWYLIQVELAAGHGGSAGEEDQLSSHSGLWRLCKGQNACIPLVEQFGPKSRLGSSLQSCTRWAFVVILLLSLALFVLNGIAGVLGMLIRNFRWLLVTGCCFLQGALVAGTGISIYMCYSKAQPTETFNQQRFEHVRIAFGWSLVLAWLSFGTEVQAGILFLLAAWRLSRTPNPSSVVT